MSPRAILINGFDFVIEHEREINYKWNSHFCK